jgi:hypothetical protein
MRCHNSPVPAPPILQSHKWITQYPSTRVLQLMGTGRMSGLASSSASGYFKFSTDDGPYVGTPGTYKEARARTAWEQDFLGEGGWL